MARRKFKNTLAEDERAAKELGLSYGTYAMYVETGYLPKYIEYLQKVKELYGDEHVNIIPSNIIGGSRHA